LKALKQRPQVVSLKVPASRVHTGVEDESMASRPVLLLMRNFYTGKTAGNERFIVISKDWLRTWHPQARRQQASDYIILNGDTLNLGIAWCVSLCESGL